MPWPPAGGSNAASGLPAALSPKPTPPPARQSGRGARRPTAQLHAAAAGSCRHRAGRQPQHSDAIECHPSTQSALRPNQVLHFPRHLRFTNMHPVDCKTATWSRHSRLSAGLKKRCRSALQHSTKSALALGRACHPPAMQARQLLQHVQDGLYIAGPCSSSHRPLLDAQCGPCPNSCRHLGQQHP